MGVTGCRLYLVLHILVTQFQLHDVLERPEQSLVEVEVWQLRPTAQDLGQYIMDKRDRLLRHVTLFVTRRLEEEQL